MQAKTLIDRIEINAQSGDIGLRLFKRVLADGGIVLADTYHRAMIAPADDPAAVVAIVNTHLQAMGFPAIEAADIAVLDATVAALASFRTAKAQEAAARADARAETLGMQDGSQVA